MIPTNKNCMNCAYCKCMAKLHILDGGSSHIKYVADMDEEFACTNIIDKDVIISITGQDPEKMVCLHWKKEG